MTDDRIKAAAEWLAEWAPCEAQAICDAAHILSLLASGKAVLCDARGVEIKQDDVTYQGLHAPLDPWGTT